MFSCKVPINCLQLEYRNSESMEVAAVSIPKLRKLMGSVWEVYGKLKGSLRDCYGKFIATFKVKENHVGTLQERRCCKTCRKLSTGCREVAMKLQ